MNIQYVSATEIKKLFQISSSTLRNWANSGTLDCVKLTGGKRLYNKEQFKNLIGKPSTSDASDKLKIIYARVSSQHQKGDLKRQIEDLKLHYPDHKVIKDIASGLNWKRQGLCSLLEQCYEGLVSEVVVAYKDRLCRFGLELLEWLFKKCSVRLVIHNQVEIPLTPTTELAEDLLAVANYFVAKNNGQRASEKKLKRKEEKQRSNQELQCTTECSTGNNNEVQETQGCL